MLTIDSKQELLSLFCSLVTIKNLAAIGECEEIYALVDQILKEYEEEVH